MALNLRIENESSLPDGGPLSVSVTGKRGIDIGRDQHLDWTLPDPTRYISGKHCEIRYKDGAYWLHDVSTNGTFLYGRDGRLKGPHRLRQGDRLVIGHYVVAVTLDGEEAPAPPQPSQPIAQGDLWSSGDEAAPPVNRAQVMTPAERAVPVRADFLDWAVDVPEPIPNEGPRRRPETPRDLPGIRDDDLSWARSAPPPQPAVVAPPVKPSPRRPPSATDEPDPWGARVASRSPGGVRDAASDLPVGPVAREPAASAAREMARPPGPVVLTDFIEALAHGARVPRDVFGLPPPDNLAEQFGSLLLLIAENMQQLLNARVQAKRLARTGQHTQIEALNNNPLKFSASAEEAFRKMFGPRTRGYLDAHQSFKQAFEDLKSHEITTYTAMQQAINLLVADLDPQAIDAATETDRGIAALVVSRKARLWDAYVARWQALASRHDGGMLDVFMRYFAECYDRGNKES
jgi:type VI secretion system protein ImpI